MGKNIGECFSLEIKDGNLFSRLILHQLKHSVRVEGRKY
jgi:hypothetical protein